MGTKIEAGHGWEYYSLDPKGHEKHLKQINALGANWAQGGEHAFYEGDWLQVPEEGINLAAEDNLSLFCPGHSVGVDSSEMKTEVEVSSIGVEVVTQENVTTEKLQSSQKIVYQLSGPEAVLQLKVHGASNLKVTNVPEAK